MVAFSGSSPLPPLPTEPREQTSTGFRHIRCVRTSYPPEPVGKIRAGEDSKMLRKALLVCGVLSSLLYVAMTVFVAMQWEGYSSVSQTVSELSAIGAPTRPLWVPLGIAYTLLVAAFGWGVLASARRNRPLRVSGGLLVAYGVIGLAWPFA